MAMAVSETHAAAEQIHDALDADGGGYHERETGVIDMTSGELARALLAAGWRPPSKTDAVVSGTVRLPSAAARVTVDGDTGRTRMFDVSGRMIYDAGYVREDGEAAQ